MSGKIKSSSPKLLPDAKKGKIVETKPLKPVKARSRVSGVYESSPPVPATGDGEIEVMLADIISRLNRIEEKIDENVYPPESAIRPEFIRQVKKAEADIRKGKGTTYESMGAFIRAISE
jgi:hypothetical protein